MKSRFITALAVRLVDHDSAERPIYELTDDLVYVSEQFGLLRVPAGFRTNFASIPRMPVIYLLAGDRAQAEATLHDYGYTFHEPLTRPQWDAVFLEAMGSDKVLCDGAAQVQVAPWLRRAMYQAVRSFGQSAWETPTTVAQPVAEPDASQGWTAA